MLIIRILLVDQMKLMLELGMPNLHFQGQSMLSLSS